MRVGMIPTYQAARGRQPGRGKSWPCHRTGSRDPWGREWRPPCWSDRTWLTTWKGLTISQKICSRKKFPETKKFFFLGFHKTLDPKFGLANSYLNFLFLQDTIPIGTLGSFRSCPCTADPHFDFPLEGKHWTVSTNPVFENEPDPEPYSKLNKISSKKARNFMQGFGSGSGLDSDSIGPVDPDPDSESGSGSGSRRAKMTHKSRKKFVKVHVLKCWMASFESWRLLL